MYPVSLLASKSSLADIKHFSFLPVTKDVNSGWSTERWEMKLWFCSSPTVFMVSIKIYHRMGITAAPQRLGSKDQHVRKHIALWVGLKGTWSHCGCFSSALASAVGLDILPLLCFGDCGGLGLASRKEGSNSGLGAAELQAVRHLKYWSVSILVFWCLHELLFRLFMRKYNVFM